MLKTLQRINTTNPLLHQLVHDLTMRERVGATPAEKERWLLERPAYLPGDFMLNVTSLLKKDVQPPTMSVPTNSYRALLAALRARANDITLDPTQCEAFAAGITRQVAVIQGPPVRHTQRSEFKNRARRRC